MNGFKFKILYTSPLLFLKRGETVRVTLFIKNTGQEKWYDPSNTNKSEHIVGRLLNQEKKIDFNLRWGNRKDNKTDRRFRRVFNRYGLPITEVNGTIHPGQIVRLVVRVEARKFVTSGLHKLELAPCIRDKNNEIATITGKPKTARVLVIPRLNQYLYILKSLKLHFIKIGKVREIVANDKYQNLDKTSNNSAVVMATWKRVNKLSQTIESLSNQEGSRPVLHLWNNNTSEIENINNIISGAQLPIQVYHSRHNIGGFGRFYLARELARKYNKVIFIDDDQFPDSKFINKLSNEYEQNVIKSQWAYRFIDKENYWHKEFVKPGETADYCGTGGMIIGVKIFSISELYDCPKRYWFIEDLWLSYFAKYTLNWKLTMAEAELPIVEDGNDQLSKLIDAKTYFYKYLEKKYFSS